MRRQFFSYLSVCAMATILLTVTDPPQPYFGMEMFVLIVFGAGVFATGLVSIFERKSPR